MSIQTGNPSIKTVIKRGVVSVGAAVAVLAISTIMGHEAHAAQHQKFQIGNWKAGVYISDKDGRFTHCAASANYKSGIELLFSINYRRHWSVGFSKKTWNLTVGNKYDVRYQVDRGRIYDGTATAIGKDLVKLNLPARSSIFNAMRRGRMLKVAAGNEVMKFSLTSTSRMLKSLLNCATRNENLVVRKNNGDPFSDNNASNDTGGDPFGSKPQNGDPFSNNNASNQPNNNINTANTNTRNDADREARLAKRRAKWQGETRVRAETLMKKVGVNIDFVDPSEKPGLYRTHDSVWFMGRYMGTMRVMPSPDMKRVDSALRNSAEKNCGTGRFNSGSKVEYMAGTDVGLRTATCVKNDGKKWTTLYAIYPRDNKSHYVLTVFTTKEGLEKVLKVGERLAQVAVSQVTGNPIEKRNSSNAVNF
ncbi:MAG: hypothetical protein AAF468_16660 [Pseudomonadota bacterium]